jgi:FkbM family methyltransferase
MLKDTFAFMIGKAHYVKYVMYLTNLYHAFCPFRHPAASLMRRLLIPRGGVVFDIGANVGRCTALAAKAVGKSGKVYSFEPVPMVLRVLRTMVRLRCLQQVVIVAAALADTNGTVSISIPLKDGWKPLVPIAHLGRTTEHPVLHLTIAVQRLDDFCAAEGIRQVDFIKCDVEGSEFAVFSGGLRCLTRALPSVVCEISHTYLARQNVEPSAVFGIFTSLGYHCYFINPVGTLTSVQGYVSQGEYLFVHPTKMSVERLQPFIQSANST